MSTARCLPPLRLRFYEELNDFLPPARRKREFEHRLREPASVKDVIESLGVPHPEVELILVDGHSVGFGQLLRGGERVSVYPMFEALDITPLLRLRPRPLRRPRFVLDAHLGALARYLRLLGFDTLYRNDYGDEELARLSAQQRRCLLTRDLGLLKRSQVTRGRFLRATAPRDQVTEVLDRLDLQAAARPFTRCIRCNARLRRVASGEAAGHVPSDVAARHGRFAHCRGCGRWYWPGSHYQRLQRLVDLWLHWPSPADG